MASPQRPRMEVRPVPGLDRESKRDLWLDGKRIARVSTDGESSEHDEVLARQLAALWNREPLTDALAKHWEGRTGECVDACAGMPDPVAAVEALREVARRVASGIACSCERAKEALRLAGDE